MASKLATLTAKLKADTGSFVGAMSTAKGALGTIIKVAGAAAAAVGTLATAMTVDAVAAAKEFENAAFDAAARVDATTQTFRDFSAAAKEASAASAFGANEAAGALKFLAKSGFDAQQATKALPGILTTAAAAGMDVARAGEIASNVLKAFNMRTKKMGKVSDVLVKASTSANTSVNELGNALSVVGGLANEAGQSLESTVSIVSKMQDAGIQASRAAIAVRAGISRLLDPTKGAQKALDKLGVSATTSEGKFKGLVSVMKELENAGASSKEMIQIFGRRAAPSLQTAVAQGADSLEDFTKELENAGGTAKEIEEFQLDSFGGALKVLSGSLKSLSIAFGQKFQKPLQAAAEQLNVWVNALRRNDELLRKVAGVMMGVLSEAIKGTEEVISALTQTFDVFTGFVFDATKNTKSLRDTMESAGETLTDYAGGMSETNTQIDKFRERQKKLRKELHAGNKTLAQRLELKNQIAQADKKETKTKLRKAKENLNNLEKQIKKTSKLRKKRLELNRAVQVPTQILQQTGVAKQGQFEGEQAAKLSELTRKQKQLLGMRLEDLQANRELSGEQQRAVDLLLDALGKNQQLTEKIQQQAKETSDINKLQRRREQTLKRILKLKKKLGKVGVEFGKVKQITPGETDDKASGKSAKTGKSKAERKTEEEGKRTPGLSAAMGAAKGAAGKAAGAGRAAQQDKMTLDESDVGEGRFERTHGKSEKQRKKELRKDLKKDVKAANEAFREQVQTTVSRFNKVTGAAGNLATNVAAAAGASQEMRDGLNAAVSGIQGLAGAAGQFATGNVFGGVMGIVNTLAGVIGSTAGGRSREARSTGLDSARNRQDLADRVAQSFKDTLDEEPIVEMTVVDSSGARQTQRATAQETREMFQDLREEARLNPDSDFGG